MSIFKFLSVFRHFWIISVIPSAFGSHFRGALFTWSPNGNTSINIDFRISWRRSYGSYACDDTTIAQKSLIADSAYISCIDGCSGMIGYLSFYCTDYNVDEDWTTGRNTILYSSPPNQFSFSYSGGDWITLVEGGGSWTLKATVDLNPRPDTGKPNTSPTVDMSPVVRLMYGCQHSIVIPVSDQDGDVVKCRWATGIDECSGVCGSFSGSTLDTNKCVLTYKADGSTGYYAVALQIEDFTDESSTTPLSSIPIQFLVYVFSRAGSSCQDKPQFVSPTPIEGACISVKVGELMNVTIKAKSEERLKSITTISAVGMSKSAETISQVSSSFYITATVTWVPKQDNVGKDHSLCFYASDENGLVSSVRCIHVPVIVGRPKITSVKQKGSINSWELLFDQKFLIPSEPAYMKVYEKATGKLVHSVDVTTSTEVAFDPENRKIAVSFAFTFQPGTKYYVLLSEAVVGRKTSCGSVSEAVNDANFWTIELAIDCGRPQDVANGTISLPNGTHFPSVITYSCYKGFSLLGHKTRTCQANGEWSGCDPRCRSNKAVLDLISESFKIVFPPNAG